MSDLSSKLLEGLFRLIDQRTRRLDYCALYPCTVVAQRADGTLDLQPETPALPAPQAVPIRYGLPGVRATVPTGTRVLLGFEGADPARPVALLWELGTGVVLYLNGGTARAAREGDDVTRTTAMATWMNAVSGALGIMTVPSVVGTVSEGSDALRLP
jgi:hypothetical protein